MVAKYSDAEIAQLLTESKILPPRFLTWPKMKERTGHKERDLPVTGADGNEFKLILRQSNFNPLDFSIILAFRPPGTNQLFRLMRFNGKSHQHTNKLERVSFYDFHIHTATERYQEIGTREDAYAERTDRYSDYYGALQCMLSDCNFEITDGGQQILFKESRS